MDFQYFFKILWRRKWHLIALTITAVVLTYFLVGLQPPIFKSNAVLSTGITIEKHINLSREDVFVQKYEIEYAFSQLIETMKSRTSIRLLSYDLLLHDLTAERIGLQPFRKIDEEEREKLDPSVIHDLANALSLHFDSSVVWTLPQEYNATFKEIAKLYGYDYESLTEKLHINRIGETDYVRVEFESENPELCEYTVNAFCQKFIGYHKNTLNKDEYEAEVFYADLVKKKKSNLDTISAHLRAFRLNNNIVNLDEQSKALVEQLKELEMAREEAQKAIAGHRRNITSLDNYLKETLDASSDLYFQDSKINDSIANIQNEIKKLKINTLDNPPNVDNINQQIAQKDAERSRLIQQIGNSRQKNNDEYQNTLESLYEKRIDEELALTLKTESIQSINQAILNLNEQSQTLVGAESNIELLESQKEIAMKEYLQAVEKLNDARVKSQSGIEPITIFEHAQVPEEPEPSKRLLFSAFAGVASGSMAVFLIFFLTLFDTSLSSPEQFERQVGIPLIGSLQQLRPRKVKLDKMFSQQSSEPAITGFFESLRKIRHHIESTGGKRFLFTSTRESTGKSLAILSLAYSLSKKNKRVLVIDTNFKHNSLSAYSNKKLEKNPLYNGHSHLYMNGATGEGKSLPKGISTKGKVDILGNHLSFDSPSEILAGQRFDEVLTQLEHEYDYILMEGASLNEYSDTRELVDYADKIIAVFDAPSSLKTVDKDSLEFLNNQGDKFIGGILNRVDERELG